MEDNEQQTEAGPYTGLDGNYPGTCVGAALSQTAGDDPQPQAVLEFELTSGPKAGERRTFYGSFKDGAIKFTFEAMRNCGWTGEDPYDLEDHPEQFIGGNVSLKIGPDTYNGKTREKVKFVNRSGATPLAPEVKARFAEDLRGKFAKLSAENPAGKAAPRAAPKPAAKPNGQRTGGSSVHPASGNVPPPSEMDGPPF